jgi:hypothetical protein
MTYAWTELAAVDANGASSSDALASHQTQYLAQMPLLGKFFFVTSGKFAL